MAQAVAPRAKGRKRGGLASLWRRKDGASAVEFALISAPFFWILFGIAEISGILIAQTTLDSAVSDAARQIRTGQTQSAATNANQLKAAICSSMNKILSADCIQLNVDVRRFTNYGSITTPTLTVNGSIDPTRLVFQPGAGGEVILMRAYYNWKIITPLFGQLFANTAGQRRILASTTLFRNEPF